MSYLVTADCTACGACLLTCPEHAIVAGLPLRVRDDRCTSCGECVEVCPADAVMEVRTAAASVLGRDLAAAAPLARVAGLPALHDRGHFGARP